MHFDPNTSTVIIGLMYCFLPISTYVFLRNHQDSASSLWCLGGLLNGIGLTVIGLRASVQMPTFVAFNIANTVVLTGTMLRLQSLKIDIKAPLKISTIFLTILGFSIVYQLDVMLIGSTFARVIFAFISSIILFILMSLAAHQYEKMYNISVAKSIKYTYIALSLVWIVKVVMMLTGHDEGKPFGDNIITAVMTLTIFVSVIFSNFGYVAMRLEKVDQEKKASIKINKQLIATIKNREKVIKDFGRFKAFSLMGAHATSVIHEIMQPLTAMRFGLENLSTIASKRNDHLEISQRIESVKQTAEKTIKIVQNLRNLMVDQEIQIQPVNLKEQINESLLILDDRLKISKIKVITKTSTRISNAMADPNQMQHVLINLLNNAIDAIERNGNHRHRKIEINVYPIDKNRHLILSIADSGGGIPNKIKNNLFEWLSSKKANGMGVGLAITKLFVESWGGTIEANNTDSKEAEHTGLCGAIFEIKLVRAH